VRPPEGHHAWRPLAVNETLLQRGVDRGELVVQIGTEAVDHGDNQSEMPAAISPYSMAVAPDSSAKNFVKICFTFASGF
jgi:hypothetical protein